MSNDISLMEECFEDKKDVQDLVDLYLDRTLGDLRSIVVGLSIAKFEDAQKKELASIYINNNHPDGSVNKKLRTLICDPAMRKKFDYENMKKAICYYMYDNRLYDVISKGLKDDKSTQKDIIDQLEASIISYLEEDEKYFRKEKPRSFDVPFKNLLYIMTDNPNIFRYRGKSGINELIIFARTDVDESLQDIITDENLLRYSNTNTQIALMSEYMQSPYIRVGELITNADALQGCSLKQHLAMVKAYADDQTPEKYDEMVSIAREMNKYKKDMVAQGYSGVYGDRRKAVKQSLTNNKSKKVPDTNESPEK